MKLFFFIFFQLMCNYGYSQDRLTVTYNRVSYYPNLSQRYLPIIFRERLICDKNLSFSYNMGTHADPHSKKKTVDVEGSIYFDFQKQTIYSVHLMPREIGTLLISDLLEVGNWIFLDRKKKIRGYNCRLAITENRIHDTTFVWFTEEIPLQYGPSKYIGFPGLVLEVLDVINRIHIKVSSIKENKETVKLPPYPVYTSKEYLEKF